MDRRKQYLIPILVLVVVLSLTIGFAAFSSNLVIKPGAEVNPDASSFKVVFSKSATSEEAGTLSPTTGNGLVATIDNTSNEKPTISNIKAKFVSPGETTTYEFYAYNKGEYKAYLTNIAFNNVTGKEITKICVAGNGTSQELVDQACEGIKIHIDVDGFLADTTMDTSGHSIEKGLSHKIVITMEYDQNAARADGPFTVTFGDIELTYKSIEGTGSSTGGLSGGITIPEIVIGETYTLKDNTSKTVVADSSTASSYSITTDNVVVLNDTSEWYYLNTSGDQITLLSKYNYFTEGANKGEMDPSGNVNAMAAVSEIYEKEFIGSCTEQCDENGENCEEVCETYTEEWFDTDYITPFVTNTIKPKILSGLRANESEVMVGLMTGSDIDDMMLNYGEDTVLHKEPLYWVKNGNGACISVALVYQPVDQTVSGECMSYPDGASAGVRIKLTVPKSYILAVLN